MPVEAVATYRPPWRDGAGRSVAGPDEDATTMVVAALNALLDGVAGTGVARVVVVTRTPALLEGPTAAVIAGASGLGDDVPVELHLGGAPAVLDVLTRAVPGTVVVGVDAEVPASAAAALVSIGGVEVESLARAEGRLPARVREPGAATLVCDDPRLLRDLGWRRALAEAGPSGDTSGRPMMVVGLPARAAGALGGEPALTEAVACTGAAAPLLALAELAGLSAALTGPSDAATVVALEAGTVTTAAVSGLARLRVVRDEPAPLPLGPSSRPAGGAAPIPASAAAYTRAFDAKVGFAGGRCECGALDLPPRYFCLACGREGAFTLERLPRTGTVYTTATIHAPVPGRSTPYSLVIVDIDGTGVRHLAPVTGAPPGSVAIGDAGRFVLRRIADREVGPDYGWAFLPAAGAAAEAPA